jgi:hypothetical protein
MRSAIVAFLAPLLAACPGGDDEPVPDAGPSCVLPIAGDQSKPIEMEVVVLGEHGVLETVPESPSRMFSVSLFRPPQGGRVVFAGVRATNIDPCEVKLGGSLRDIASNKLVPESRVVNLDPAGDDWVASNPQDIASFSNIATCPNQWSDRDLYDVPYELSVAIRERKTDREVQKTFTVIPRCSGDPSQAACEPVDPCSPEELLAECACKCKEGYALGDPCP